MSYLHATATMPVREEQPYDPAAVVRHLAQELRQPLGTVESIGHYLNMVLPRTEAKARNQLGKLEDEVRHMHWILTDALHFLQAAPLNLQLLDLTEIVSKSLSEWSPQDGAGLILRLQPGLPLVRLDLEQIEHLLRNAVAFFRRISAPGRSAVLQTYGSGGKVTIEISSETLEYSAQDVEPLFEPFREHLPAGSGLALASAHRIAEAHGGRIEAIADPPHKLTVLVTFPAA